MPIERTFQLREFIYTSSLSGQDQPNSALWLDIQACKMATITRSWLPTVFDKKIVLFSHITNPLLTKLVPFLCVYDRDSISVHKQAKKEIGQYPVLVYTTQVNSTFRARWLASSEVISQVLFTSEQPKKNKVAFVAIF